MYYYKNGVTTFLWKETLIVIILICAIFIFLGIFTVRAFNKVIERYYPNNLFSAENTLNRIRSLSGFLSLGVRNDKMCLVYNHTCYLIASIELLRGNERDFLRELDGIKKENSFEIKSFMLSLYYRSKHDFEKSKLFYDKYLMCNHHEKDMQIVLSCVFDDLDDLKNNIIFKDAVKGFKNPAIIKLFQDNNIL